MQKLDSVIVTFSNPYITDTTDTSGQFSINFNSSEENNVMAILNFKRNLFYDTTITVIYGPTFKLIDFGEIKMATTVKDD